MDWTLLIVVALVILGFLTLKRLSFVSATLAQQHLLAGALVIDVRSTDEFQHKHLPSVINIPLGQLRDGLPRQVPDKNQVLLLYCHSGGRSAIAQRQAKHLGYPNVFNLGSYGRAERIIQTATNPSPSAP
jgi:phage shock protein E